MKKSELISYIEKYHLGGIVESVLWEITNDVAKVGFVATENSTAGFIYFPFPQLGAKYETDKLGIASTSSLIKMLNVMGDEIEVSSTIEHKINMSLNITDGTYQGKFSLADIYNLPEVPAIIEPKLYELSMTLDKEFRDQYLKAYKALGSINRMTIEAGTTIKFTLGNKESYANKISFTKESTNYLPIKPISFSGEAVAAILKVNDCSKATLDVSEQGLMRIYINDEGSSVTYFIVELEDL